MRVSPALQLVNVPNAVDVDIAVDSVVNLGAYQFTLSFNPSVVYYLSVQNGTFLGSTGRSVLCNSPTVQFGSISFGCITLGSTPLGANGTGVLARVHLEAIANGVSSLTLSNPIVADITGTSEVPLALQHGVVYVGPTPVPTNTPTRTPTPTAAPAVSCADLNGDHLVRISDITIVVARYGTTDPAADLDHNGLVLIPDILIAVYQYGQSCP